MLHWYGRCIGWKSGRELKFLGDDELVQRLRLGLLLLQIVQCCSHWEQITGVLDRFNLWSLISTLTELVEVLRVVLRLFLCTVHWLGLHMVDEDRGNTQWRRERRRSPWGSSDTGEVTFKGFKNLSVKNTCGYLSQEMSQR